MMATGAALRDAGIERVLAPNEAWRHSYREILAAWLDRQPVGMRFTGETLREVATSYGLGEPHHFNAWGGCANSMLAAWRAAKRIKDTGATASANNPRTHAHALRLYEVVGDERVDRS